MSNTRAWGTPACTQVKTDERGVTDGPSDFLRYVKIRAVAAREIETNLCESLMGEFEEFGENVEFCKGSKYTYAIGFSDFLTVKQDENDQAKTRLNDSILRLKHDEKRSGEAWRLKEIYKDHHMYGLHYKFLTTTCWILRKEKEAEDIKNQRESDMHQSNEDATKAALIAIQMFASRHAPQPVKRVSSSSSSDMEQESDGGRKPADKRKSKKQVSQQVEKRTANEGFIRNQQLKDYQAKVARAKIETEIAIVQAQEQYRKESSSLQEGVADQDDAYSPVYQTPSDSFKRY